MKKVKLLVGAAVVVAALMVAAVPAAAKPPAHDGDHSLAIAIDLKAAKISNFNMGWVGNFVYTWANTGWNDTAGGDSDTGNATAEADVSNDLNSNSTKVEIYDSGDGPLAMNQGEGIAIAADATLVGVCNFNMGSVLNLVATGANTGGNETGGMMLGKSGHHGKHHHDVGGDSDTGNATAEADVSTTLNSSTTKVTICDFENGPMAVNLEKKYQDHCGFGGKGGKCGKDGKGPLAVALDLTAVKVCNFNVGYVMNMVGTMANSGWNDTNGGDSMTGNAKASASVATTLNTNKTTVSVMEGGSGALAMNKTGHGGLAIALEADLVGVDNLNMGCVANMVTTAANTGLNDTSGGSSDTGKATASTTVTNDVNANTTSVSISGDKGAVAVNSSSGSTHFPVPCEGCVDICEEDGVVAANLGTSGTAVAADVDAAEVTNVNVGEVTNVVSTVANTGDNETGGKDGGCGICGDNFGGCPGGDGPGEGTSSDTGDASASTTVDNTVNSNSTTVVIGGI